MKTILVLLICSIYLWLCNTNALQPVAAKYRASLITGSIDFKTQVQPVLQKNCSPCHFPGGKLYQRLPFDKGITIINHEGGILKRIKKDEEVNLIRQYVVQNKVAR